VVWRTCRAKQVSSSKPFLVIVVLKHFSLIANNLQETILSATMKSPHRTLNYMLLLADVFQYSQIIINLKCLTAKQIHHLKILENIIQFYAAYKDSCKVDWMIK